MPMGLSCIFCFVLATFTTTPTLNRNCTLMFAMMLKRPLTQSCIFILSTMLTGISLLSTIITDIIQDYQLVYHMFH